MTKIIAKHISGAFKFRILTDAANEDNPAFNDVLFDGDNPVLRITEAGHSSISPNGGGIVLPIVDIGYVPLVLAAIRASNGYFYYRRGRNMSSPGATFTIPQSGAGFSQHTMFPNLFDGETYSKIQGLVLDVTRTTVAMNNYWRTGTSYRAGYCLVARE
jgi:hypothetical protein